jgi:predicted membrane channel-forming protein YqfA (hemolysin III family)
VESRSTAGYHRPVPTQAKLGDILANAITHGIGAVLAVVGAVYLIAASTRGTASYVVSCTIFAITLVLVYLCSTLYHSLVLTRAGGCSAWFGPWLSLESSSRAWRSTALP